MVNPQKFRWGRGYGAFSVSASAIKKVKSYIRNQEKHHRNRSFMEELDSFLKAYGVEEENR